MNNLQIPEAFISIIALGTLRGYFPVKSWNRWSSLGLILISLSGAALVLLWGIYDTILACQLHGPAMIDDKMSIPLMIALFLFASGLLAGWGAYANWNKGVAVYERGFAFNAPMPKDLQIWRWEDVVAMTSAITRHYTNGIYTGTTQLYTFCNHQNQRLVLSDSFPYDLLSISSRNYNVEKVEQLAKNIEQNIFALLYGRAADQYNTGQSIVFGSVAISKAGIAIGKKTYPWMEVKEVSIRRGILKVSRKDGSRFGEARAAASTIPNLRVLLSIIEQVTRVNTG